MTIVCLVMITGLRAQELVRSAAAAPLSEFKRTPGAFFYLGPFQEELTGIATVQYTDNVNLTATNKISDLSFAEGLSLDTTWIISHLNQIQLTLGGRVIENFYGNGREQTNLEIDPNSKIELKFEISDVKFRFYDQFSYVQNPTTNPVASNTTNLNNLTNTIGLEGIADLSIALFSMAADYTYNNESGTNVEGQNNAGTTGSRSTFRFSPKLTFQLTPAIVYGITATASRSNGSDSANVNSLSFGPFISGKLSPALEFDLSGGIDLIDTKPAVPPGYYVAAAFRYQINRFWQVLFDATHDTIFTTGTALSEENLFRLRTQFAITRNISFSAAPFLNFGTVETTTNQTVANSGSNQTGPYSQYGIEANLAWRMRKRWHSELSYNYVHQKSSATFSLGAGLASSSSYVQNIISLSIGYEF